MVKDGAGEPYSGSLDPLLADGSNPAPVLERAPETYPAGIDNEEEYLDYLYDNHFEVMVKDDLDKSNWSYTWFDEYYFFGLNSEILSASPYLQQTKGWNSMSGDGTFDPLAE